MNNILKFGGPVAVLCAGAGIFALLHWTKPEPQKKTETARPVSVFVEPAERANVDLLVTTSGEVRAKTAVDIFAQIPGRVVSVSEEFVEGGVVRAGEPLVVLDDTDFQLALIQARVQVAGAEVQLLQAQADADVARKQLANASQASDLALKRPQIAEAEARLAAARADLEQARLDLDRTRISLPFDGRLQATGVNVGQFVTPATRLGRAFATDVVEVRISLSDSQLASLDLPIGYVAQDEGLAVVFSANVAGREQFWQGRLTRLDAAIDPATRMLYGTAEVTSPYQEHVSQLGMPLAVGLFVNAEVVGRRIQDAVVIPRDALRAGDRVYVVNSQGKLEFRDVVVTHSSAIQAVIEKGISENDQVIISSIRNPIEGMVLEALRYSFEESSFAHRDQQQPVGS
ncbi:MAG: efflux RND transporter periplasmic adaptor subunit [Pseudomonadota bacterium]